MFTASAGYESYMGRWSRLLAPKFIDFTGIQEGDRVLDVGTGTGSLASSLERGLRSVEVVGIDPSQGFIAFAQSHAQSGRVRFELGDAQALGFPDAGEQPAFNDADLSALSTLIGTVESGAIDSEARMQERFTTIAGTPGAADALLAVEGRTIAARRAAADVVWFDFAAICDGPRSQADYVEIARDYHTVLVSGVPCFDAASDNQARRFIALVDELYDRNVKLVIAAASPPEALYRGERLAFEFERTRSRLVEMQSHDYLARPHKG